ncbi:hypothetical protein CLU96_2643 [Chryseobacterium sp. 52]|uniref:hypothetical protein n=1 Tax=Chryseobacterium sp. 52 TaxID=2035213 RepID=UPI000C18B533|nr:hypothetical protein [Chryseobacterium sp. 52]PIF45634.1 hypothetical protein CLU96_2643 [Chryseobacterium sp. 52]
MDLTIDQIRNAALHFDQNITRLQIIIKGLNNATKHLLNEEFSIDWWGTLDQKYEYESIYRLAILSYEKYIRSTIEVPSGEEELTFYKSEYNVGLIITLAKYITSAFDNPQEILDAYHLKIDDYPIYNGIIILNKDRNLEEIIHTLEKWRVKMIYLKYTDLNIT